MVKTRLTPTSKTVSIEVPESYVGHEIEILVYSKSDFQESNREPNGPDLRKFTGIISKETASKMEEHLKKARSEWDRDIF